MFTRNLFIKNIFICITLFSVCGTSVTHSMEQPRSGPTASGCAWRAAGSLGVAALCAWGAKMVFEKSGEYAKKSEEYKEFLAVSGLFILQAAFSIYVKAQAMVYIWGRMLGLFEDKKKQAKILKSTYIFI